MMPAEGAQLALPFPRQALDAAEDFIAAGSNGAALAWLGRGDWPEGRLAIWGQAGCGKSHLLHAWVRQSGGVVLQGAALRDLSALPLVGVLAVDETDAVPQDAVLLHLLNTARERGLTVLLAARTPPARWPVRLPDLASRLRAMTAAEIQQPEDDLLQVLLMRMLAERQLEVPCSLQDWMLRRLPRSPGALRDAVACLDREGMETGKTITRPFAAHVLAAAGLISGETDDVP